MSDIAKKTVSIFIDQTAAEVSLTKLQAKADALTKSIDAGKAAGKSMTSEIKRLGETQASIKQVQDAIDKGLRPSFIQQENLVRQLHNELKRLSEDAPGYAEKLASFKSATAEFGRMKEAISGVEKAQKSWLKEAGAVAFGVLVGNTVQSAVGAIGNYVSGIVSGNAKLSDSLADIQKSTGLSATAVAGLNSQLNKIDTRTPTEQLRQIAIGLGQINEAATPENVAAIDKIVVALGDEFGGDANQITNVLSVLRNNLQDIKTKNYGDDVGKIGNALNVLGAEGLATAPVVTDIANRMAGVAETFGLSSGQILGTAATFQELGIESERGSTAFVKILQRMTAEPEKFAKIAKYAGISTKKDFIDLLNTDMLGAFTKVAEGAKIAGSSNVNFGKILSDLNADGSGAGEVLSKLATNEKLLSDKVKLASDALTNQNSITAEFNTKNSTFGAELEKLSKRLGSFISNSTITQFFTGLIKGLNDVIQPTKSATQQFDELSHQVNHLNNDILPLANRYDELKTKTNLSKTEQTEMKSIISQITSVLPGAVTQFDAYGNAIAISTDRVRDFIKNEKDRLQLVNRSAIEENQDKLKQTENQLRLAERKINEITKTGTFSVTETSSSGGISGGGATTINRKASEEEIAEAEEKYKQLLSDKNGYNQEIKRLNGQSLQEQVDDQKKQAELIKPPVVPTLVDDATEKKGEELLKQLKDFQFELQQVGKQADDSEIQRITKKYNDLITEAGKYGVHLVTLEAEKNRAIAFLIDEETRKRKEASDKQFKENTASEYDNQIAQSALYFEKLKEQQAQSFVAKTIDKKQYEANIAAIDVAAKQAQLQNANDYSGTVEKAAGDVTKFKKEELEKQVADLIAANAKMLANEQLTKQLRNDAAIARATNKVNTSAPGSSALLDAQKALLEEQKAQELAALDDREQAAQQAGISYTTEFNDLRAEINEKYRQSEKQKEIDHYAELINIGFNYLSNILSVVQQFNQAQNANEQKALDKELKGNDLKKNALKRQLDQKLISQQEYQREVNNLDKEAEQKKEALAKKQFERNKKFQIAQALIDIPKAILTDIRNYGAPIPPNFLSIGAIALDSLLGGLQIAAIAKQQYAEGGRVNHPGNGRITVPSNIPAQPNGDDVLATVRRGEVILNECQQAALGGAATFRRIGVPGFAFGGAVRPGYQTRSYQAIDFAGASRSIMLVKQYANGGVVGANANNGNSATTDPVLLETLKQIQDVNLQLAATNIKLQAKLDEPLQAQATISLKQIDDAREQKKRILNQATFQ